jgi:hypothetical protein
MVQILSEVEQVKHKHTLNSLATILNEFPDFAQMIEGQLNDNGIQIPSRP